jgi:hypothetical protein
LCKNDFIVIFNNMKSFILKLLRENYKQIDKGDVYAILKNYKFEDDHMDHHHGQDDYRLYMYDHSGNLLAKVHYNVFQDKTYISFIESIVKGFGYGKIAMIYLAQKYGYENLLRSNLTSDGADMRVSLDDLFDFDYEAHLRSLDKHLSLDSLEGINDEGIKYFLYNLVKNGYSAGWDKWKDYLRDHGYYDKYDMNDISEIAGWVRGSKSNDHYSDDEVPQHVLKLLSSLKKG